MDSDNLCTQPSLDEQTLLELLATRYANGKIYTHAGLLLLSFNPYCALDIHGPAMTELYRRDVPDLSPHVFLVLREALAATPLLGPHTLVVSGESGAGKTETVRLMLGFLGIPVMDKIDLLLEAFGNACTINNSNSSRFGRLVRLEGSPSIEAFLLEKSRVTSSFGNGNRNFHIFYYLLAHKNELLKNDYIDNSFHQDEEERNADALKFVEVQQACEAIGIDFQLITRLLEGILKLGSIQFTEEGGMAQAELEHASSLLGLSYDALYNYLKNKPLRVCGELIVRINTAHESRILRDSIARLLYDGLFEYVTKMANTYLQSQAVPVHGLGILDIFGFEDLGTNGLDQFCINWCNERIYDEFVNSAFEHQKRVLFEEGVLATPELAGCRMGESCLPFIEKKCGLADLISEESFLNGTVDSLAVKAEQMLQARVAPGNRLEINHFAGMIRYDLADFLAKNKELGSLSDLYAGTDVSGNPPLGFVLGRAGRAADAVDSFRRSLHSLFGLLSSTTVRYIKCIKPNSRKEPLAFDGALVASQLRANGVLQAVELSKRLFPYAIFIDEFEERYKGCLCRDGLVKGRTRYFFNNNTFNALEMERESRIRRRKWAIVYLCKELILRKQAEEAIEKTIEGKMEEGNAIEGIAEQNQLEQTKLGEHMNCAEQTKLGEHINCAEQTKLGEHINCAEQTKLGEHINCAEQIKSEQTKPEQIEQCINDDEEDRLMIIENELKKEIENMDADTSLEHESNDGEYINNKNNTPVAHSNPQCTTDFYQLQSGAGSPHPISHTECAIAIQRLEDELAKYKQFSVSCANCQALQKKYRIQSQELINKRLLEIEVEKLRIKLKIYEDSSDSSLEPADSKNALSCLIQLYLDYSPVYSTRDIPRDEMVSLAHALAFVLSIIPEAAIQGELTGCLEEVEKRIPSFEGDISTVTFMLSNMAELRLLLGADPLTAEAARLVDPLVSKLFLALCTLQKQNINELLPAAVLEHQHLKEFKVRESIYKKLFVGPSIIRLTSLLDYFYSITAYFHLPDALIINNISFILSYLDFICFNALLAKRKFLSFNRTVQINFNLAEIEKFCHSIGFPHGFYNVAYMKEAMKIAMVIGRDGCESSVSTSFENSLLNSAQVNGLIELFDSPTIPLLKAERGLRKFIDEPKPIIPSLSGLGSASKFVKPKYLPEKSIKSIMKILQAE